MNLMVAKTPKNRLGNNRQISIKLSRYLRVFCIVLLFFGLKNVAGEIVEEIYYLVDEELITKLDFESELQLIQKNPESNLNIQNPKSVISNMIIQKLIHKKLKENNIKVKDSDISNYINVIIDRNNISSIENFYSILAETQNIDYKEYQTIIRRKLNYQYYITRLISTPPINNREIEEYYQRHRETFFKVKKPILNLSVITLLMSENTGFTQKIQIQDRILKIKKEIQSGSITFTEAVRKYSEDEVTKNSSGLIGWADPVVLGIGNQNLKTLQSLPKGSVSELIRDHKGISLYRINDIIVEGYIPYDLAIQESKQRVFEEKQMKAFVNSLKELIDSSILVAKKPELKINFNFSD